MPRISPLLTLIVVLAMGSPGQAVETRAGEGAFERALAGVKARHAWTRETAEAEAPVFLTIENGSERPVTLLGGETDMSVSVSLVRFRRVDGVPMLMVEPPLTIPPGETLSLAPGGLALRLTGLRRPLREGVTFDLALELSIGLLEIPVTIENEAATRHHAVPQP